MKPIRQPWLHRPAARRLLLIGWWLAALWLIGFVLAFYVEPMGIFFRYLWY
ncbi:hypothetical protein BN8_03685 [Fibrisoma limi BUZ 3]|uniref:Uncharacterized protein n=1 Tax=Fibrisoma limi BUZ 3 TaxID=1185876 RepID=I2GKT2_9BACT|nr:hypothetical protein [Fibrisoma limi]CCH54508.1 hypothetical protein BN8_03685 [Fibrisoma limi BUZ 3]